MSPDNKLVILSGKIDLLFEMQIMSPLFLRAINAKNPQREWDEAVKEQQRILKKYKEILKIEYENTDNLTSEPPSVS